MPQMSAVLFTRHVCFPKNVSHYQFVSRVQVITKYEENTCTRAVMLWLNFHFWFLILYRS